MCLSFPELRQLLPASDIFIMPGTASILRNQEVEITSVINYNTHATICQSFQLVSKLYLKIQRKSCGCISVYFDKNSLFYPY